MTLEEYLPCQRCGGTARYVGLEQTPAGMRKKFRSMKTEAIKELMKEPEERTLLPLMHMVQDQDYEGPTTTHKWGIVDRRDIIQYLTHGAEDFLFGLAKEIAGIDAPCTTLRDPLVEIKEYFSKHKLNIKQVDVIG